MKISTLSLLIGACCCAFSDSLRADLVGVATSYPQVSFVDQAMTSVTYSPSNHQFQVQSSLVSIEFSPFDPAIVFDSGVASLSLQVDAAGALIPGSGVGGFTLSGVFSGQVNGLPASFSGVLLRGDIIAFGSIYNGLGQYDFRVNITGGALMPYFSCADLGVNLVSEKTGFDGGFTSAFNGSSKGELGPNDQTPPTVVCPPPASIKFAPATDPDDPSVSGFIITYPDPMVTDNCDPQPMIYCDTPSGTFLAINAGDSVTVTCYGIDAAGNYDDCVFTAVAQLPSSQIHFAGGECDPATLPNDPGVCSASYAFAAPVATNETGGQFTAVATAVDENGAVIPLQALGNGSYSGAFPRTTTGTNIITYTADDGQGDTVTRQCQVFVVDREAPAINCQAQAATFKPVFNAATSSISAQFNCNAIDAGETIWFSGVINTPSEASSPFTVRVSNQTIQLVVDGQRQPIVIPVPDATLAFDPTTTLTTTLFTNGAWATEAKPRVCGSTFFAGIPYFVTNALAGCETKGKCTLSHCCNPRPTKVKKIQAIWSGTFQVDKPGIVLGWQWAAATYSRFNTNYDLLGVKPADASTVTLYHDGYSAGTPENYKNYWMAGASGDRETACQDEFTGAPSCNTRINLGKGIVCLGPVDFKAPTAIDNCDGAVSVTCTPPSGSIFGPGDYPITCTAADKSGNTNRCSFTLTVLPPLQVVFVSPASDNLNDNTAQPDAGYTDFNCPDDASTPAIVNQFTAGSKVLHAVRLLDCGGNDVTAQVAPSVTAHIDVTERTGDYANGALVADVLQNYSWIGSSGNVMAPICGTFQYNLDTKGYEAGTVNNKKFFRSCVWVDYNATPGVPVGMEDVILESK